VLMFGQQGALTVADPEGEYVSVELRLFPADAQGTPVELVVSGVRRDFPRTSVPLAPAAFEALTGNPRTYGQTLGKQLFEGTALGTQLLELLTALDSRGARWRLRIRLDDPTLETLRWERLCLPKNGDWSPIGSAGDSPFSRFVPVTDWKSAAPIASRPVQVLLIYASPANLANLNLPAIPPIERDAIRTAFTGSPGVQVSITELASDGPTRPTVAALREALTSAPAIVHVLCHGTTGPAGSALILERDNGDARGVDPATLRDAFRGAATPPRLVVLSACESAAATIGNTFVSLGGFLARESTDAVLAMSEAVSVTTAREFCSHFYERLFAHGVLDRAVNEARAVVRDSLDWGAPVLFARMRDCQLLDFAPSEVDALYLGASNRVTRAAAAARQYGERQQVAHNVIEAMNALIEELERSHKVVTGLTGRFRRTGSDPATFVANFEVFRNEFKDYYDNQSWRKERTRCGEVSALAETVMPLFKDALPEAALKQFEADLLEVSSDDVILIEHLKLFLDQMDAEVEEITKLLRAGDVAGAVKRKLAFEDQISPTFRRSKELLAEIGERSHAVQAA
jgi:hypothetical protein